ncbi:MAG: response regulator, partial [Calditrichia bacterium]|nr:response regulator [Calditrichia bacterium]
MKEKILFVDDEEHVLSSFKRTFRKEFDMETANSGKSALRIISSNGPFSVIVSDMRMPEMNGVQLLSKIKDLSPDT